MFARAILGIAVGALLVASSAYLLRARRESGHATMPVPSSDATLQPLDGTGPRAAATAELGIALRLIDELGNAQIDAPSISDRQVRGLLTSHWRRHITPFVGPGGDLGRMVQSVGLSRFGGLGPRRDPKPKGTSASQPPAGATSIGRASSPQATQTRSGAGSASGLDDAERQQRNLRTFGLGEGTYDERECILAPPPATLRFGVQIPKRAQLRVAPAVLGDGEVTFTIAFRPAAGGERVVLGSTAVRGPSQRYNDWTIDLPGNSAGHLELLTEAKSREPLAALWGSPVIVAPNASRLPYNVLFIIVDAMRNDALAASHDPVADAQRKHAKLPPLDAWFDAIPEVAPELNRLAGRGAIWTNSWSAAMWTRPSTLSLLTGLRASHTGLEILALELIGDQRRNFYARRPPLLPLLMRRAGATTAAIVNNMYLSGSLGVGIDFGFEVVVDHRFQAIDTRNITNDALRFLSDLGKERFFLLLNYSAPHAPYVPPAADLAAVKAAPNRPADTGVQHYLGEVHKDDAAIGQVLRKLDEQKLAKDTIVVVTADHGETMSAAHDIVAIDVAQGVPSGRFTHLSTMWEEAARVPLIMALPGKIPNGKRLEQRVQGIDVVPTILQLEGLAVPAEIDGRSLLPELEGRTVEERPVVIEGRGARSIIDRNYHLIVRDHVAKRLVYHGEEFEKSVELYDLALDPGERNDIAPQHSALVETLRGKLARVLSEKSTTTASVSRQRVHLRFATAGKSHQLEVILRVKPDQAKVVPIGIEPRAIHAEAEGIRVTTATSSDVAVGFDVEFSSPDLRWQVKLDDKPWPAENIYAGPLGLLSSGLLEGLSDGVDRTQLDSPGLPHIVATEEVGMFVTRDPLAGPADLEMSAEAQLEAQQAMQAWGYARKSTLRKTP
jgi:arylsulfatase A-like enzyme